jgi:hypothetical protein
MMVPVITMEEVPVLSDEERADLIASLKQAEADVAAGGRNHSIDEEFKKRFWRCRGRTGADKLEKR